MPMTPEEAANTLEWYINNEMGGSEKEICLEAMRTLRDVAILNKLTPLKKALSRIRDIAYGGGLERARKVSVDALKAYIDLAIKFTKEAEPGGEEKKALTHKAERVNDLMHKGCEPHWRCVQCGECVPFHCYTREQFEERKCKGTAGRAQP